VRLWFLLPMLGLLACATIPRATPEQDAAAKLFEAPAEQTSALYIYRSRPYGRFWRTEVSVVGFLLTGWVQTDVATGDFLRIEGRPGQIDVGCKMGEYGDHHRIDILPGQIRYFRLTVESGLYWPYCLIHEVPAEQAQPEIRGLTRVFPI
jgi:hypothetical protein